MQRTSKHLKPLYQEGFRQELYGKGKSMVWENHKSVLKGHDVELLPDPDTRGLPERSLPFHRGVGNWKNKYPESLSPLPPTPPCPQLDEPSGNWWAGQLGRDQLLWHRRVEKGEQWIWRMTENNPHNLHLELTNGNILIFSLLI